MSTGTMTSKGQITVPKDVRDALGLVTGTKVAFEALDDGGYRITPIQAGGRLLDLVGLIPYDGPPATLDEMQDAIAAGALGL